MAGILFRFLGEEPLLATHRSKLTASTNATQDDQTYGMVIDYKSGGAHVTAQDVYGLKLQLMTYLLALESPVKHMADLCPLQRWFTLT